MEPILFNPFKHHLRSISEQIRHHVKQALDAQSLLKEASRSKGVVDVYEGDLTAREIENEVLQFLQQNQLLDFANYKLYLETHGQIKRKGHYSNFTLSDSSIMTLRISEDTARFVHIHPARYSPHTFRIKANTLKTVIIAYFMALSQTTSPYDIQLLNQAREKLELSPIPDIPAAISRLLNKFEQFATKTDQ